MKIHPDTLARHASQSIKPVANHTGLSRTPAPSPRAPALAVDAFVPGNPRQAGATYTRRTRAELNAGATNTAAPTSAFTNTTPARPAPALKKVEPARAELAGSNSFTPTPPTPSEPTVRQFGQKDIDGVLSRWGAASGDKKFDSNFDVNGDGQINLADLAHITQNLPPNTPGGTSNENG